MKKIIVALVMMASIVSCNSSDSKVKYSYSYNNDGKVKREMIQKNSQSDIEINMEGNATFSANETTITALSEKGFINYRNKDIKLNAVNDKKKVIITIKKNGTKISNTSDTGKEILTEAIREIKKLQGKYK
jgi:hypothetical protein